MIIFTLMGIEPEIRTVPVPPNKNYCTVFRQAQKAAPLVVESHIGVKANQRRLLSDVLHDFGQLYTNGTTHSAGTYESRLCVYQNKTFTLLRQCIHGQYMRIALQGCATEQHITRTINDYAANKYFQKAQTFQNTTQSIDEVVEAYKKIVLVTNTAPIRPTTQDLKGYSKRLQQMHNQQQINKKAAEQAKLRRRYERLSTQFRNVL